MVLPALLIVGLAVGVFIFRDEIKDFLTFGVGGIADDIGKSAESLGGFITTNVQAAGETLGNTAQETLFNPIFAAGQAAGIAERERAEAEAIRNAEAAQLEAAKSLGFNSVEEFNKVTDSGSVVIGGEKQIVDFGLIGDVIPTNPSPEFLASEEGQRIFGTRGSKRFGGQQS